MQIRLGLFPGDKESALTAQDAQFNPAVLFSSATSFTQLFIQLLHRKSYCMDKQAQALTSTTP